MRLTLTDERLIGFGMIAGWMLALGLLWLGSKARERLTRRRTQADGRP